MIGIALVLGLFTKWTAFAGALMNLNYRFAGSANGYMLIAEPAMVFGGAGVAYYRLDHFLLPYLQHLLTRAPQQKPRAMHATH
ncbi:MAG TPA: hypothetical protein VKY74_04445 [Chloroflexia bacterium]|nr:hypothetical protein [Chloroflexia bacterium]